MSYYPICVAITSVSTFADPVGTSCSARDGARAVSVRGSTDGKALRKVDMSDGREGEGRKMVLEAAGNFFRREGGRVPYFYLKTPLGVQCFDIDIVYSPTRISADFFTF